MKQFREITHKRADLCFVMKANPFLVGPMAAMTDRIEVCSMGEFRICQEAQIPVQKLVISGVLKKKRRFLAASKHLRGRMSLQHRVLEPDGTGG